MGSNNAKQAGIYLFDSANNTYQKIVSTRDEVNRKTVRHASMGAYSLSGNLVAMHIQFKNGDKGLYYAKINA